MQLSGQFDPRAHLRLARRRLRNPALHRHRGSEGTLGGLVEVGRRIHEHIRKGPGNGRAMLE